MTEFDGRTLRFAADHANGCFRRILDAWVQLAQEELRIWDAIAHEDQAHHVKTEIPDECVPVAIPQSFHKDAHDATVVVVFLTLDQWPPGKFCEEPCGEYLAGRLQAQSIILEARNSKQAVGNAHLWSYGPRQRSALRPRLASAPWDGDSSTLRKGVCSIRCATLPSVGQLPTTWGTVRDQQQVPTVILYGTTERRMGRMTMADHVHDLEDLNRDADSARVALETLLHTPRHGWRALFVAHPRWGTLTTFRGLLAHAHDQLDHDPVDAVVIARFVLRRLGRIDVAGEADLQRIIVGGTAWKEFANALRVTGRQRRALDAATRAMVIFGTSDALAADRASAMILRGHIQHELGDSEAGLRWLDEATTILQERGEERRVLQTMMLRGIILYETKCYAEASDIFAAAHVISQQLGDKRELARIENNQGHCALKLGNLVAAWDHLVAAATGYVAQGMTTELPRAEWGLARLMQETAAPAVTAAALQRVYTAFAARGMVLDAANVLLEVATILSKDEQHRDQTRALCEQLGALFATTNMPQEAHAALAHLRENALKEEQDIVAEVVQVRRYFRQLRDTKGGPAFAPGH
jgi:tetratricopeptide (TPR) repeat protein